MLDICNSLIKIENGVVLPMHHSLREYSQSTSNSKADGSHEDFVSRAPLAIAKTLLSYISHPALSRNLKDLANDDNFEPTHPLADAAYDSDHHWQPLADLISQLPGLADVVYRCTSQFPPCLLKAMHANDKPARLHLQMFKLRSAYDGSATIDPHEWEIILSPCLHSIWLQYRCPVRENGDWLPSRQLDTLRRIVQQGPVSPGLKEVKMVYEIPSERGTLRFFSPDETGTMPDPANRRVGPCLKLLVSSFPCLTDLSPAPAECRLRRYRMGHIYDAFINSALDASLAQEILAAVGGNVETLLVRTFRGLSFPGEAPDWGMPGGTSLASMA
ncbi:hypothetical protein NEMBOFW57_000165 [Staphylotrichum longicolle]|uniref:Uncharacterized protein n=1 Tax=Staphylotrichum longicolle TaxID=669026 RepID=A0AAD4F288_9PEZI|nr:hypothetical protein NEMBOFW57_000165 [Staphylotrichum longicolle]